MTRHALSIECEAASGDNDDQLAISDNGNDDENDSHHNTEESNNIKPLDQLVLEAVRQHKDAQGRIRPARLAAVLGNMSVDDANAELCGLLAAVGGGSNGASFTFEQAAAATSTTSSTASSSSDQYLPPQKRPEPVMVFTFPNDFETRAKRRQRRESWQQVLGNLGQVAWKATKILTAFGLILSLLLLCLAAMLGLVAAIVALSSQQNNRGGGHHRTLLLRQLRSLFYMARQLLWFYAVFGPDDEDENNSNGSGGSLFMREAAYDLALCCSVCCGNPLSFWYWMRARQLAQRRQRVMRGWSSRRSNNSQVWDSGVEGVYLIRRGEWSQDTATATSRPPPGQADDRRGLLSVAVEFLFGPTPFYMQTHAEKWKLRAAVVVYQSELESSLDEKKKGVPLASLSPYADDPPISLEDASSVVAQGLQVVSHFHGVPSFIAATEENNFSVTQARFIFPELMAESAVVLPYKADDDDNDPGTWQNFLWAADEGAGTHGGRLLQTTASSADDAPIVPNHLHEPRYKFTRLPAQQWLHCLGLGLLNAVGVYMLGTSLEAGGVLREGMPKALITFLQHIMLPPLQFYAKLFFALPAMRMLVLLVWNEQIRRRNQRRLQLATELLESGGG